METGPLYCEKKLAKKIGVTDDDLRFAREALQPEVDWQVHKKMIVFTAVGLPHLLEFIRATLAETVPATFEDCRIDAGTNGAAIEMEVVRIYPNRRLLQARTTTAELVNVRVRTNVNFVPKMKLKARLESGTTWEMEGRCPRTKGRY